ncbi:MAG: serine/threonine-protein kinase [Planctomycetota bacterium]|nr:serine/threonine-protein kinase [Planctomycetota bacterium]
MIRVSVSVTAGPALGRRFVFDEPAYFLCGRVKDAHVSLPHELFLSREHFMLNVEPDRCTLLDLDSKNGTLVNGVCYGGRKATADVPRAADQAKQVELKDGDEIQVGVTRFEVRIERPSDLPHTLLRTDCSRCGADVSEEAHAAGQAGSGAYVCAACRKPLAARPAQAPKLSIPGYTLQAELGRGGMGVVFKGVDDATGETVAIKTMLPAVAASQDAVARFNREILVNASLNHPNLVRFLNHGRTDEGVFFFVMEFVDGMDLAAYAKSAGVPALAEFAPLMLDMLAGLAFAHTAPVLVADSGAAEGATARTETGIVHRDLKPANVLLRREGGRWTAKVTDFGLAKSFTRAGLSGMTAEGDMAGTPAYWPREQITHYKYLSPASDVFSMAAVFVHVLTGAYPRRGFQKLMDDAIASKRPPMLAKIVQTVMRESVPPARELLPALPGPVAAVLDRALREQELPPGEAEMSRELTALRYPHAGAFLEALRAAFAASGLGPFDRA